MADSGRASEPYVCILIMISTNTEKMKVSISTKISNHDSAQENVLAMPDPNSMPIEEAIDRIIMLNEGLRKFWNTAEGWAPMEAAKLLNKSRLDRQVSLSHCLRLWVTTSSARSSRR